MQENNNHLSEVYDEFRTQLMGRNKLLDTLLPALVFMLVNRLADLQPAIYAALFVAAVITVVRLTRRETFWFALGGFGGVLIAVLFAWWLARAEGYFLPNIISNAAIVGIALISLILRKPLVALASALTRQWPLGWFSHPRVLPAYVEVTLAWTFFLSLRLIIQVFFFQNQSVNALGTFQLITGTPATILLLVLSYLYGAWRLKRLQGPSVVEYTRGDPPPWEGQKRGF